MRLVDSWTDAGRPWNEDAWGATPAAAWVIDGTKGPFEHSLTDATWYAQLLNNCLLDHFAAATLDPRGALARTADQLSRTYRGNADAAPAHEQPSACLALASLDASGAVHLLNIGDCRILIEKAGAIRRFGSSDIEPLETAAIAELIPLRACGADPWPRLRATFRRNFEAAMNKPGGYWVTHPTLPWLHAVQHVALPSDEADHLLIASDGFFRLVNVFGAYDEAKLVAAALAGGLAALGAELRGMESEDPNCLRYPRLKSMDDASAVLVRNGT
jgi:hypothetical protein